MVKSFFKILLLLLGILFLIVILGPVEAYEQVDNVPMVLSIPLEDLDQYVAHREKQVSDIKVDNASKIIWHDSIQQTEYALVYLHGFEASHGEGDPITLNFAQRYGMNLYLPRISQQGRTNVDALLDESPKGMVDSAKEAIAIGKLLGRKVIVMSCSTGSTYSSYLAANDPDIYAQIMASPNFDLGDPKSKLMTKQWGKQVSRAVFGGNYHGFNCNEAAKPYWNYKYRIEGLIALRSLIDQTMTKDIWSKNNLPTYICYWYKSETERDDVISIPAIKAYANTVSTPQNKLVTQAITAGRGHVISSKYMNNQWEVVQDSIFSFADKILKL